MSRANDLTKACIALLEFHGFVAWRNNVVATPIITKGKILTRQGRPIFRKAKNTNKGTGDIIAVAPRGGRHVEVEIKIGADRQRETQKTHQEKIEWCGAIYLLVHDTVDELREWLEANYPL